MVSRITQCLQSLQQRNHKALIPYITAGDPDRATTRELLPALVKAGADIIELGVPFSDPMADGIVIQQAHQRALAAGMDLSKVLDEVAHFRKTNTTTPIVLMSYVNPIETMGYAAFAAKAQQAGVDGTLLVDLPVEESESIVSIWQQHQLDRIFLLSPTTSTERIQKICNAASGYVYFISIKGVTGAKGCELPPIEAKIDELRKLTHWPICIGFGIDSTEKAAAMAKCADGIIVGSALVKRITESQDSAMAFLTQLRQAI